MFLAQLFLGESPPELLDLHYKIRPVSDHVAVAKFQGDRSRDLGERRAKKTSAAKYKPARNCRSGRPKSRSIISE